MKGQTDLKKERRSEERWWSNAFPPAPAELTVPVSESVSRHSLWASGGSRPVPVEWLAQQVYIAHGPMESQLFWRIHKINLITSFPFMRKFMLKKLRNLLKTTQLESGRTSLETQVHPIAQATASPLGSSDSEAWRMRQLSKEKVRLTKHTWPFPPPSLGITVCLASAPFHSLIQQLCLLVKSQQ